MAEARPVNKPVEEATLSGLTPPRVLVPLQEGLGSSELHNRSVGSLRTGLDNIFSFKHRLQVGLDTHLQAVREQERWIANRKREIEDRSIKKSDVLIEYPTEPALDVLAETPQPYFTKVQVSSWGTLTDQAGPWSLLVVEESPSPYGPRVASRWRLSYDHSVTLSEIDLGVSPETVHLYNVHSASVSSVIDSESVELTGVEVAFQTVQVDVLSGPSKGASFLAQLNDTTLTNLGADLKVGDDLEIGIRCDVHDIGGGLYEIEYIQKPITTQKLDVLVGSNRREAWIGLPKAETKLKVYAPVTEIESLPGPEPLRSVILHSEESIPDGGWAEHFLLSGGIRYSISHGVETAISSLVPIKQIAEQITLDRFLSVQLSWLPYLSEQTITDNRYGFNPNLSGARGVLTLSDTFGNTSDSISTQLKKWNVLGPTTEGGGYYWNGITMASGGTLATQPRVQFGAGDSLLARPEYGQPYGQRYSWVMRQPTYPAAGTASSVGLWANEYNEVRVRGDHFGNSLSVRMYRNDATTCAFGLYQYSGVSVTPTTLGAWTSTTVSSVSWYLYTLLLGDSSATLQITDETGTSTALITTSSITPMPSGPGISFHHWGAGSTYLSSVDVKSDLPHLAPIQVTVTDNGVIIPPDKAGVNTEDITPRFETVRIKPDSESGGLYRLPYPPVRRLYESSLRSENNEAPVRVVEWIEEDQVEGEVINDFEIDVRTSTLRIRDQKRTGPIQISYWTMRRKDIDVPITRNTTDYLGVSLPRTLRPANFDIENREYFPIVEYRHSGNRIYFAEDWGKVEISYDSYAVNLGLVTRLVRGFNPCRSPRIIRAYWETN